MAYKRKVEFSRRSKDKLDMYSASALQHFLGAIDKDKALSLLSKSQRTKINKLFEVDEVVDKDIVYYKADKVVLSVNKTDFKV